MKKILILIGVCVALFAILFITLALTGVSNPSPYQFEIDGQKVTTTYFGNEVTHDFNGDGRSDRAYLVTYSPGGSGTFYYVVVTLDTPRGLVNSEAYLLGDRIAPQTTEVGGINGNTIIVNYADRELTDSFVTPPSIGKTVQLILDPNTMKFGVVTNNFEGEANPAVMTLTQQKWNWVNVRYSDGKVITPNILGLFSLTFKSTSATSGSFSAGTDCNTVSGEYTVSSLNSGSKISLNKIISTMMACQNSQEGDYIKALGEIDSYHFTSKGELVFDLKIDSGTMSFK